LFPKYDRTSLAIAGPDFCIVASDTRQSEGYLINSRYSPKAYQLSNATVLATNGFRADGQRMTKELLSNIRVFRHHQIMLMLP